MCGDGDGDGDGGRRGRREALHDLVVGGPGAQRSGLAEAGDGAVDQPRVLRRPVSIGGALVRTVATVALARETRGAADPAEETAAPEQNLQAAP
ncbi:hypothetical protein Z951_02635 [Streptomyces sp. PRh5]|nr:hypothetical protein Z951_02635 [Streptomyces sp. PRh5]